MRRTIIIILVLILSFSVRAQINSDSILNLSSEYAKNGNYSEAKNEALKVLALYPQRTDVIIHLANIYSWQGNFDSAKIYIQRAYSITPQSIELYNSWLNMLLWNKEYAEIHKIADLAMKNGYTDTVNIAKKKLIAYKETGNYDEGLQYARSVNKELLKTSDIRVLYNEIYTRSKKNLLSAYYSIDFFDQNNTEPQHLAYVDYSFRINKHTLVLRSNYAYRYYENGIQLEADYYHLLNKGRYFYFNYGYGFNKELFPIHRAGIEYIFPLVKTMEASLGGRYLGYDSSDVFMATGHIEKYTGRSWFSLRPYFTFNNIGNALTLVANYRLYGNMPANYWGLELTYGNSPDDRFANANNGDVFRLDAFRVKAEKSILLSVSNELKLSFSYSYEEYADQNYRNRYVAEILLKHRF